MRAVILAVAMALMAGGDAAGSVYVANPRADAEFEPLAGGFAQWLENRLADSGIPALRPPPSDPAGDDAQLLAEARELGADWAVFSRLRLAEGLAEIRMRLYAPATNELAAVATASAALESFGESCERAALQLLGAFGLPPEAMRSGVPPQLDELAATSRALMHLEEGRLALAWREVEGRLTPTAIRTREQIVALARETQASPLERARVLAASGDPRTAWRLIAEQVGREQDKRQPEAAVWVAAGEVQLAAGNLGAARGFFESALRAQSRNPEAQLGLARVLAAQHQTAAARSAFARAAELDASPRPLLAMAELETGDPSAQAAHLLEAGRRAAGRLDVQRAERYLQRAVRLEPSLASESWRASADLEQTLGRSREAVSLYQRAEQSGASGAGLYRDLGRAHRTAGDPEAAELALRRSLLLEGDDPETLRELGLVYLETGRATEAVELLAGASRARPDDDRTRQALARALHAVGRSEEALALLEAGESIEALREAASIHTAAGRPERARAALTRAVSLDPADGKLLELLAEAHAAVGDAAAAERARDAAARLGQAGSRETSAPALATLAGSFEALAISFASQTVDPASKPVAQLGVRFAAGWRELAAQWLYPRAVDRRAVESALNAALGRRFDLVPSPPIPALLEEGLERLRDFESQASLDAQTIGELNQLLGTHAVFLGTLRRVAPEEQEEPAAASCAGPDGFELELRMLAGKRAEYAAILANLACPEAGLEVFGRWNPRAFGIYALLLLALLYPALRGWGTILVRVELPPRTKGFFSLRVSRNPDAVSAKKKQRERFQGLRRTLRYLSRYHRSMVGRETSFRWIPVRPRPYTVTLMGPLKEATSGEIIGHFLEERRIRVRRGKLARLEYDLRPSECAVEVQLLCDGRPARQAQVAVAGVRESLRYAPEGTAFLYLRKGSHRIVMGAADRVAEQNVEIRSLDNAIPVCVDLADPNLLVFDGCPEAVDPYLQGDYANAASALGRAGRTRAAHLVRAEHHRQRGDAESAAAEFEAAGCLEEAAELRANSGSNPSASALLFERAGDHGRAAESYRQAGDLAAAARAYEAAYDFDRALECYDEVGNEEKVIELLERTGAYLDAAQRSRRRGDAERAMRSLQHIARNDSSWVDGCALLAELLAERGDQDIAVEKFAEALEGAGGDQASADLLERHARLLEKCGEPERALKAWTAVARRDPGRKEVGTRISMLREEIQRSAPTAMPGAPSAVTRPAESRYERLGELGRGGMGVVYKARDRRLGRLIALKELPANLRDHPEAVKLFLREARAAASLNHRNIVTVHDAGEENGTYFISMELLEGMPLNKILARRGRLLAKDVARLGVQIAAGLAYAAERRVVHRDIKTANLFFTRDRVVKIMDFGLAKTIEEVRKSSTLIGGTPYYMAPEQAVGGAVDHRSDLYAFGVTLFQLLTGDVPFRDGDLAYHHRSTPAPDPREVDASVPELLARLVLQLLEKDPAARPQSAGEVGSLLQKLLTELD